MNRNATTLNFLTYLFIGGFMAPSDAYAVQSKANLIVPETAVDFPLLFDDFSYPDERALFGRNQWTDVDGNPGPFQRLWYRSDWSEAQFRSTARLAFKNRGQLRMETEYTHSYQWKPGYLPPIISSGFTARTGTWATRVRFDDISIGEATFSPITQAFWTFSPNIACITDVTVRPCANADKHWSEFNHEWNNYFSPKHKQFLANGGVVDGEQSATGAFTMRDPENPLGPDLTCRKFRDFLIDPITDPEKCMAWFVSNGRKDRFSDLFIQYDGTDLILEAVAWDHNPAEGAGDGVVMRRVVSFGRSTQPMIARYSIIGRTHQDCLEQQLSRESCWRQDGTKGFSIDWFFYSSQTNLTMNQILSGVKWLRSRRLSRVNTLGIDTDAPFHRSSLRLILEPPSSNDKREWVVVPSLRSTRSDRLKIEWSFRTRLSRLEAWTGWSDPKLGGFTFNPELKYEAYDAVDVRVIVTDWHDADNSAVAAGCISNHGRSYGQCEAKPEYYVLGENYPDPFNPETTISFEIPKAGMTTLEVYDALGRRVATLVNQLVEAGGHSVRWNASGMPNGLYFYSIRSGLFSRVKQMVLLR